MNDQYAEKNSEFKWLAKEETTSPEELARLKTIQVHPYNMTSMKKINHKSRLASDVSSTIPEYMSVHGMSPIRAPIRRIETQIKPAKQSAQPPQPPENMIPSPSASTNTIKNRKSSLDNISLDEPTKKPSMPLPQPSVSAQDMSSLDKLHEAISKKLKFHVDTSVLINKPAFKNIMNSMKSGVDAEGSSKRLLHSLHFLLNYFESLIRKMILDHKSEFLQTEFVKSVFAEEIDTRVNERVSQRLKRYNINETGYPSKGSPVSFG